MTLRNTKVVVFVAVVLFFLLTILVYIQLSFPKSQSQSNHIGSIDLNSSLYQVNEVLVNRLNSSEYNAKIGIELTSYLDCPESALSLNVADGSILGSHGINTAVTYYFPKIDETKCDRSNNEHTYLLSANWNRRSDTDWKIIVPGYTNIEAGFPLFVAEINASTEFKKHDMSKYLQTKKQITLKI